MGGIVKEDLKRELKAHYTASATTVSEVDAPRLQYLMVDGEGDTGRCLRFETAMAALYPLAQDRHVDDAAEDPFEVEERSVPETLVAGLRMKGRYERVGVGFKTLGNATGRYAFFGYGAVLNEGVLIGNLAIKTGKTICWDAANRRVVGVSEADRYIHSPEPREGWLYTLWRTGVFESE